MASMRYTNWMLTLIAACLVLLTLQRVSIIPVAQAQATTPTPVMIVGVVPNLAIPVNLVALGKHTNIPVSIVAQTGKVAVDIADAIAVTNRSDGTPLTVQVVKPTTEK